MADVTKEEVKSLTFTEWLESYDQQPSEIINGEVVLMHPPDFVHSWITLALYDSLSPFVKARKLGKVFIEAATVIDASEEENWVKGSVIPDVFFITQDRLLAFVDSFGGRGPLRLAPDLAVEIVSTNDSYTILNRKVEMYLEHGVRLVWVIDPARRKIRVHTPADRDGHTIDETATLDGGEVLAGWSMPVSEIMDVPGLKALDDSASQ